jgi:hypothetical protein
MKTPKRRVPGVFQWIRAARDKINRETEGMTPDEWCAYIRDRAEAARNNRVHLTQEEAVREQHDVLYNENTPLSSPRAVKVPRSRKAKVAAPKSAVRRKVAKRPLVHA